MIKKILFGLVAIIAIACGFAASQSDDMIVERSSVIAAPPDKVFAVVNDFKQWDAWSPWNKLDPNMKKTFEGPTQGVGAIYKWSGNMEAGEGTNTLTESKPNESIVMKLEMTKPFKDVSTVRFAFAPEGAGTKITWRLEGKKPFMGKVVGLFMDCEKMCGDQFNEGLANLAKHVTSGSVAVPAPAPATPAAAVPAAPNP